MSEHGGYESSSFERSGNEFAVSPEPIASPEPGTGDLTFASEPPMGSPGTEQTMSTEQAEFAQEMQQDEQLVERLMQEGLSTPPPSEQTQEVPQHEVAPAQPAVQQPAVQQPAPVTPNYAAINQANEAAQQQSFQAEQASVAQQQAAEQQEDDNFDAYLRE